VSDLIDAETEFGSRTERRLREDTLGWLVTAGKDGTPQPNPVWFLWDGQSLLIYSAPDQAKLKNIERNPPATSTAGAMAMTSSSSPARLTSTRRRPRSTTTLPTSTSTRRRSSASGSSPPRRWP